MSRVSALEAHKEAAARLQFEAREWHRHNHDPELFPFFCVIVMQRRNNLMKPNVNTLERAFELARTGQFDSVEQIKARLHKEGYSRGLVAGKYLSAQLRQLMRQAHPESYGV